MTTMKESIKLDKASKKSIRHTKTELGTIHNIAIDGKTVKNKIAVCIDQVLLLSKSTMFRDTMRELERLMVGYWNLPEEQQIRGTPDEIKIYVNHIGIELEGMAEHYEKCEKHAKPAMFINDIDDKVKNVLDVDYFKESDYVEADFPYVSIGAIMKDKSLNSAEKGVMVDRYLEMKERGVVIEAKVEKESEAKGWDDAKSIDDVETVAETFGISEEELTMEDALIPIFKEATTKKTTRELYDSLCQMYPKKFQTPTVRGKIGWESEYRGETYIPTLITYDAKESKIYQTACLLDSRVKYIPKAYLIPDNGLIYFVRTNQEL